MSTKCIQVVYKLYTNCIQIVNIVGRRFAPPPAACSRSERIGASLRREILSPLRLQEVTDKARFARPPRGGFPCLVRLDAAPAPFPLPSGFALRVAALLGGASALAAPDQPQNRLRRTRFAPPSRPPRKLRFLVACRPLSVVRYALASQGTRRQPRAGRPPLRVSLWLVGRCASDAPGLRPPLADRVLGHPESPGGDSLPAAPPAFNCARWGGLVSGAAARRAPAARTCFALHRPSGGSPCGLRPARYACPSLALRRNGLRPYPGNQKAFRFFAAVGKPSHERIDVTEYIELGGGCFAALGYYYDLPVRVYHHRRMRPPGMPWWNTDICHGFTPEHVSFWKAALRTAVAGSPFVGWLNDPRFEKVGSLVNTRNRCGVCNTHLLAHASSGALPVHMGVMKLTGWVVPEIVDEYGRRVNYSGQRIDDSGQCAFFLLEELLK